MTPHHDARPVVPVPLPLPLVTVVLLGLAFGQIVAGPLNDRLGRRPVLLWGLTAFGAADLAAAACGRGAALVAVRLFAGLAASRVGGGVARDHRRRLIAGSSFVLPALARLVPTRLQPRLRLASPRTNNRGWRRQEDGANLGGVSGLGRLQAGGTAGYQAD